MYWLNPWPAQQKARGSISGLTATILKIGYFLHQSRDMAEISLERRKFSEQSTNLLITKIGALVSYAGTTCLSFRSNKCRNISADIRSFIKVINCHLLTCRINCHLLTCRKVEPAITRDLYNFVLRAKGFSKSDNSNTIVKHQSCKSKIALNKWRV